MEIIGQSIGYVGLGMMIIGSIWFLVVAFQQDILWGIACVLIPFVSLVYLVKYWNTASRPFITWVAGFLGLFLGKFVRDGTIF